jgi:hypothetical protein
VFRYTLTLVFVFQQETTDSEIECDRNRAATILNWLGVKENIFNGLRLDLRDPINLYNSCSRAPM